MLRDFFGAVGAALLAVWMVTWLVALACLPVLMCLVALKVLSE